MATIATKKTKYITTFKADPIISDEPVPNVEILINDEVPIQTIYGLKRMEKIMDYEAEKLADALFESLPQGVLDRLLYHLMGRKASVYLGKTGS
jgi:hypothetical protein